VAQTISAEDVEEEVACTLVIVRAGGDVVVLAPLTNPAQPLRTVAVNARRHKSAQELL
jgi:hypothetical protein